MKKLLLITTILAISLTSCLKDKSHYVDFANAGNIVNMPLSGLTNFSKDALTADHDTIQFAVDYATVNPNGALTVTIGVDTTYIAKYEATNSAIQYHAMPSSVYKISTTSVSIPAAKQYSFVTLIVDKTLLDPAKSYMLPIVIKDAQGVPISSNMNVHYYHVIGNDFAGAWRQTFRRWSGAADSLTAANLYGGSFAGQTATFVPVSPTEFVVYTGYDGGNVIHYDVTFTKNSDGTYSNFNVQILPADVALVTGSISFTQNPVFEAQPGGASVGSTIAGPLTYAQALKIFNFQFVAQTSAPRYIVDYFYK